MNTDDVHQLNLAAARAGVAGISGKRAWNVKLGLGSFLTLSFGASLPADESGQQHGEWYLWTYECAWRIDNAQGPLVGSEDDRARLREAVRVLEGRVVRSFELAPNLEATLQFDEGLELRMFPVRVHEAEHWLLWRPDGVVLLAARDHFSEQPAAARGIDAS